MAHECEECGEQCYCDMDDCGGLPQPDDCRHYARHFHEDLADDYEDEDLNIQEFPSAGRGR